MTGRSRHAARCRARAGAWINFFDPANSYSAGTSEDSLCQALRTCAPRNRVVIASKVYFNPGRLSCSATGREINGTLRRLGTNDLNLCIIHCFDYEAPIEETMQALKDLVQACKVRALEPRPRMDIRSRACSSPHATTVERCFRRW